MKNAVKPTACVELAPIAVLPSPVRRESNSQAFPCIELVGVEEYQENPSRISPGGVKRVPQRSNPKRMDKACGNMLRAANSTNLALTRERVPLPVPDLGKE